MTGFKSITFEDKDILEKYLNMAKHRACDYSIGNLILWQKTYETSYIVVENFLIIKFSHGKDVYFSYPIGQGNTKPAIDWIMNYCKEENIEFTMNIVEPDMFEEMEKLYPGEFEIAYQTDNADYIYNIEDLKNLSGKKYHGKKNHINKFLKVNEDWVYEPITDANTLECIEMTKEWCIENGCCQDKSRAEEVCVMINGLMHRKELGFIGGIIRLSGKIIAITMGEQSGEDMFIIHFEKAFAGIQGAYPMINQQFIIHELTGYAYVNREEDMGVEGLRKAKESYYPAFMAEKGIVTKK